MSFTLHDYMYSVMPQALLHHDTEYRHVLIVWVLVICNGLIETGCPIRLWYGII